MLSAYGIERSKTVARLIRVLPTSGAKSTAATASAPNPTIVISSRCRTGARGGRAAAASVRAGNRHHRQVSGTCMELHVGIHFEQEADVLAGQRVARRAVGNHAS